MEVNQIREGILLMLKRKVVGGSTVICNTAVERCEERVFLLLVFPFGSRKFGFEKQLL